MHEFVIDCRLSMVDGRWSMHDRNTRGIRRLATYLAVDGHLAVFDRRLEPRAARRVIRYFLCEKGIESQLASVCIAQVLVLDDERVVVKGGGYGNELTETTRSSHGHSRETRAARESRIRSVHVVTRVVLLTCRIGCARYVVCTGNACSSRAACISNQVLGP